MSLAYTLVITATGGILLLGAYELALLLMVVQRYVATVAPLLP